MYCNFSGLVAVFATYLHEEYGHFVSAFVNRVMVTNFARTVAGNRPPAIAPSPSRLALCLPGRGRCWCCCSF